MVAVLARELSNWKYETASSGAASVAFLAAEKGKLLLRSPSDQGDQVLAFDYTAFGAGASLGLKLPGFGKLELGGKIGSKLGHNTAGKPGKAGFSGTFAAEEYPSYGVVYILESFKGRELGPKDFTGFCLLLELGGGVLAGVTGAAMVCGLSVRDSLVGLPEEFVIDTAIGNQIIADQLNRAGITDRLGIQDASSVILMVGYNQGLQALAGGTAYLGYVSLGGPPDEEALRLDLGIPTPAEKIVQFRQTVPDSGWITVSGDVLFKFGRYDLRPTAQAVLAQIATLLLTQRARRIMVHGYTDSIGPAGFNDVLSKWRAKTAALWLERRLASKTVRIEWRGHGAADPVAPNRRPGGSDNPAGRRRNRRVEIYFYKN